MIKFSWWDSKTRPLNTFLIGFQQTEGIYGIFIKKLKCDASMVYTSNFCWVKWNISLWNNVVVPITRRTIPTNKITPNKKTIYFIYELSVGCFMLYFEQGLFMYCLLVSFVCHLTCFKHKCTFISTSTKRLNPQRDI